MKIINRREFIKGFTATSVALSLPVRISAQNTMPVRPVPSTGMELGIVGYGNAGIFSETSKESAERSRQLVDILVEAGGNYIDTNNKSVLNFGEWLDQSVLDRLKLMVTIWDREPPFEDRALQALYDAVKKQTLDFMQLRNSLSMNNINEYWPKLRQWKEEGRVRHIGATTSRTKYYDYLEAFMKNEAPDFVQVNYSLLETESGKRLLPLAKDLGIAVITNRPFINGKFFELIRGKTLPEWAKEFDCQSWAQFSLKFILAHPAVTCVIAETSKPKHAKDNVDAAFGRLPDDGERKRMLEYMKSL